MFGWDDLAVAGVNLVGNWLSGESNYNKQMNAMREQQAWQEKMNAQQQEWQENMWNKTNEYNTPQAQLDRMVQAGINPNNSAMQVAGGSNNAQLASQPEIPGAASGFNPGMDLMNGVANSALLSKQSQLLEAQKENIEADTKNKDADVERKNMENSVWLTTWNADMALKGADIENKKEATRQLQFTTDVLFPQEEEINEQTINNLQGAAQKLGEEIDLIKKQQKTEIERAKTEQAQQGLLAANTSESKARTGLIGAQKEGVDLENAIKGPAAKLAAEYGIDSSKMEALETLYMNLYAAGYNEDEVKEIIDAYFGSIKNNVKKGFSDILRNPLGAVKDVLSIRGLGKGKVKGVPYSGSSKGSTPNPQSGSKRVKTKSGKRVGVD